MVPRRKPMTVSNWKLLAISPTTLYLPDTEWRTQPLWGLGLLQRTTGTAFYLFDGRARTLEEAILWHDGEAAKSKKAFTELNKEQRAQLMKFHNSL